MQKLAIFGGTFNPVHWGHLLIAETALSQLELDRIVWVPAYQPPHKAEADILLSYDHRFEMVKLALADHPCFEISAVESERAGRSYAIDTLRTLQTLYPDTHWHWIIGLDAFQHLPRWYAHRELAQYCCWVVAPRLERTAATANRQKAQIEAAEAVCAEVAQVLARQSIKVHWQILQMPIVEISSSLIRQYCHQQRSIRYLVSEPVRTYILQHHLYQE
jgi:nicotinate-nucleotide adenylyltransferase